MEEAGDATQVAKELLTDIKKALQLLEESPQLNRIPDRLYLDLRTSFQDAKNGLTWIIRNRPTEEGYDDKEYTNGLQRIYPKTRKPRRSAGLRT